MITNSVSQISITSALKPSRPYTAITIQDMYKTIDQNSNLQWQTMNYKVPRHYYSAKPPKKNNPPKDPKRTSYLDNVEILGKTIPGVGKYNINYQNKLSFSKWNGKCPKRKTLFVETFDKNKRCPTPGPASYFLKQSKSQELVIPSKSRKRDNSDKTSYLGEVQYLGHCSPGIGQYNISTNILKPSFRNNKGSRPQSSTSKSKLQKLSNINPIFQGTFSKIDHYCKKLSKSGVKKSNFAHEARFPLNKQKTTIPGPNKYNHDKCVNSTLIRSRSVYY